MLLDASHPGLSVCPGQGVGWCSSVTRGRIISLQWASNSTIVRQALRGLTSKRASQGSCERDNLVTVAGLEVGFGAILRTSG